VEEKFHGGCKIFLKSSNDDRKFLHCRDPAKKNSRGKPGSPRAGHTFANPSEGLMRGNENRKKVVILTDTYRIKGYIELQEGARVTDYMLGAKEFIVVTDAEVWTLDGTGLVLSAQFIDVRLDQIEVVTTTDKQQPLAAVSALEQAAAVS